VTTIDARAWLVWLLVGGMLALIAANPFYLILLLVISRLVQFARTPAQTGGWRLPFWRISLAILIFSTLFNLLTAHVGQTILLTLPANWVLIGGPITLEAAVYGLLNGLRLITLLSFFLAFNIIVPVSQLAGLIPGALHELGLVLLIAVTYVPETVGQFKRIREAQAIRGHRLNGLRDWRPVLLPLLIAGLERALNLAETMVSRGYGSTALVAVPLRGRLAYAAGLLLSLAGALQAAWAKPLGIYFILAGVLAVAWAYFDMSRRHNRTQYRPHKWTWVDSLVVTGALVPFFIFLLPGLEFSALGYSPYPIVAPPAFDVWIGLSLFGLVVPAVLPASTGAAEEAKR
jgi:energy-coupling factor transport system permease protein